MDYSASINETDDPAASPWGNGPSLPPHETHTEFPGIAGEPPSSPFPYNPQTASLEHSASQEGLAFPRPGTTSTEPGTEAGVVERPTTQDSSVAESADESYPGASQETSNVHEQIGQSHRQAPQAQQQQAPYQARSQFKLQAKITGLERTGKKDPVLRFDVHVGSRRTPESPMPVSRILTF